MDELRNLSVLNRENRGYVYINISIGKLMFYFFKNKLYEGKYCQNINRLRVKIIEIKEQSSGSLFYYGF